MSAAPQPEELTVVERDRVPVSRFGDYLVVDRIATGGMGTIDLAVHAPAHGVERPVALKRLRADLTDDAGFVRMFVDEVRIAARISHPHVVPLLNAGYVDGQWFYTMDLLLGVPLKQARAHLGASPDPAMHERWPAVLCRVVQDACEGLHAAHELRDADGRSLGVVHRDVSLDNLFLGFDGGVRVIDFGIASARDRMAQTRSGEVRGKIAYIAPERLTPGAEIDRRADVWSLGVVLWEGLTGERLFFRPELAESVRLIRAGVVPPIREHREVSLDVEEVVARALTLDPARRFATTRELGRALARAADASGWRAELCDVADWINQLLPGAALRQRRVAEVLAHVQRDTATIELGGTTKPTVSEAKAAPDAEPSTTLIRHPDARSPGWTSAFLIAAGCALGAVAAGALWWWL